MVARHKRARTRPTARRAAIVRRSSRNPYQIGMFGPTSRVNMAFDRWFRDSVVVDERGSPMVLYHGTRSPVEFEVFATGTITHDDGEGDTIITGSRDPGAYLGPHFAEEAWVASNFAAGRAAAYDRSRYVDDRDHGGAGGRVIPVFLSLRNVKRFDSEDAMLRWIIEHGNSYIVDAEIGEMIENGQIKARSEKAERRAYASYDTRMEAMENLKGHDNDGDGTSYEDACEEFGTSARAALLKLGYDGVRYRNEVEGGTGWVALEPGTVKSAVGNNGNWDARDPSIVR